MTQRTETAKEGKPCRFLLFVPQGEDLEIQRKRIMGVVLSLIGISALIPLGILAYGQNNLPLAFSDHLAAFLLILNFYLFRKKENVVLGCYLGMVVVTPFYFYLFFTGGVEGTAALWYYTFPLLAFFL